MNRPRFRSGFHEFRAWVTAGGVLMIAVVVMGCRSAAAETVATAFVCAAIARTVASYWSWK